MGIKRNAVSAAQRLLNAGGANLVADGSWGRLTAAAYANATSDTKRLVRDALVAAGLSPEMVEQYRLTGGHEMKAIFQFRVVPEVQRLARERKLNAQLMVAQLRLESGGGGRVPPGSYNWGGIKARRGEPSVEAMTTEVLDGKTVRVSAPFRKFESPEAFAQYYVQNLASMKRYAAAYAQTSIAEGARMLMAAGYATDPQYSSKLVMAAGSTAVA